MGHPDTMSSPEEGKPYSDILLLWKNRENSLTLNPSTNSSVNSEQNRITTVHGMPNSGAARPKSLGIQKNEVIPLTDNLDSKVLKKSDHHANETSPDEEKNKRRQIHHENSLTMFANSLLNTEKQPPSPVTELDSWFDSTEVGDVARVNENVEASKSPSPTVKRSISDVLNQKYNKSLPRQRKISADNAKPETKPPLGYYGTMALMHSRKLSRQDPDAGLLFVPGQEPFSRSWHFDRKISATSPSEESNGLGNSQPEMDQPDGDLANSFSDFVQKYKNDRKRILSTKEKGSESDSDSDMEHMKNMLRRPSFDAPSLKVQDEKECPNRMRRIGVVNSPDGVQQSLKPIEEGFQYEEPVKPRTSSFTWSGNTDNLDELKKVTSKLNLNNANKEQLYGLNKENDGDEKTISNGDEKAAIVRINNALGYLRNELRKMYKEDQILAKKLLYIRKALKEVRLEQNYDEYRTMLYDTECYINVAQTMESVSSICEVPVETMMAPSLKNRGITKLNINDRRFSVL